MPLVFAAIAPHGRMAIAEWCKPQERALATMTRAAMEELGRRFAVASPDVTVVLTPHNIHVERGMAVVLAGTMAGTLEGGAASISLRLGVDREFAIAVAVAVRDAGVPIVAVSYGANDTAAAVFPMDWGTQVPLHFMGGRDDPPKPIVMIAPARDLPWDAHTSPLVARSRRPQTSPPSASHSSRHATTDTRMTRRGRTVSAPHRRSSTIALSIW